MTTSIFLARILAVTFLSAGLGSLLNKNYLHKVLEDFLKSPGLSYLGGLIALWLGFMMVNYHNVWVSNWTVVITILGWLTLLKGMVLLIFPKWAIGVAGKYKAENTGIFTVMSLVLGLVLAYFAFFL